MFVAATIIAMSAAVVLLLERSGADVALGPVGAAVTGFVIALAFSPPAVLAFAASVSTPHPEPGVADERLGEQPPLEPGVLGGPQLRGVQAAQLGVGPRALDGVADRPGQQGTVHLALDQVVLRAGRHGLHGALLVGQAGQHEHRRVRSRLPHRQQPLQPQSVGKAQIQQHSLEARAGVGDRLGHGAHPGDLDVGAGLVEQIAHQEGVAGVVLDEEHLHGVDVGQGACRHAHRRSPVVVLPTQGSGVAAPCRRASPSARQYPSDHCP